MMFPATQRGLRLLRSSWMLIYAHPKLLIFPAIGRGIYLLAVFAIGIWMNYLVVNHINLNRLPLHQSVSVYATLLGSLFLCNVIGTFLSGALSIGVASYQANEHPSIREGLQQAKIRFLPLLSWISFALTAGLLIRMFHRLAHDFKSINRLLSGLPWVPATFFVNPIITYHACHLFTAIGQSSRLMLDYAGPYPRFNASIVIPSLGIRILSIVPFAIGMYFHEKNLILLGSVLSAMIIYTISVLNSAFQIILHHAVYFYVIHKKPPRHFAEAELKNFMKKQRKGL